MHTEPVSLYMASQNSKDAYPALLVVGKGGAELPATDEIRSVAVTTLEDEWNGAANSLIDARRDENAELQDEVPPNEPINVEGVYLVFDQSPAPEAKGLYDGPILSVKKALTDAFEVSVWDDAVILDMRTNR